MRQFTAQRMHASTAKRMDAAVDSAAHS